MDHCLGTRSLRFSRASSSVGGFCLFFSSSKSLKRFLGFPTGLSPIRSRGRSLLQLFSSTSRCWLLSNTSHQWSSVGMSSRITDLLRNTEVYLTLIGLISIEWTSVTRFTCSFAVPSSKRCLRAMIIRSSQVSPLIFDLSAPIWINSIPKWRRHDFIQKQKQVATRISSLERVCCTAAEKTEWYPANIRFYVESLVRNTSSRWRESQIQTEAHVWVSTRT